MNAGTYKEGELQKLSALDGNLSMQHSYVQASDKEEDDELLIEEELVKTPARGTSVHGMCRAS